MTRAILTGLIALGFLSLSLPASAEADPKRGERVYNRCKACHVVDREQNRSGPHLVDLFGREAGTISDFRYSEAMKESSIVWNEETLDGFLKSPRDYLEGNRMAFAGLRNDRDRQDVIAFLKQATPREQATN